MNKKITKSELWNLPNEQIAKRTRGRLVRIVFTNGEAQKVVVKTILAASNPPHLFTGFLTTENKIISLSIIDYIELD